VLRGLTSGWTYYSPALVYHASDEEENSAGRDNVGLLDHPSAECCDRARYSAVCQTLNRSVRCWKEPSKGVRGVEVLLTAVALELK
jgi:hypothetical protein